MTSNQTSTPTLTAVESDGGWIVRDDVDGFSMWHPNEAADEQIAASNDPAAEAVRICSEQPARGEWHS